MSALCEVRCHAMHCEIWTCRKRLAAPTGISRETPTEGLTRKVPLSAQILVRSCPKGMQLLENRDISCRDDSSLCHLSITSFHRIACTAHYRLASLFSSWKTQSAAQIWSMFVQTFHPGIKCEPSGARVKADIFSITFWLKIYQKKELRDWLKTWKSFEHFYDSCF